MGIVTCLYFLYLAPLFIIQMQIVPAQFIRGWAVVILAVRRAIIYSGGFIITARRTTIWVLPITSHISLFLFQTVIRTVVWPWGLPFKFVLFIASLLIILDIVIVNKFFPLFLLKEKATK